MSGPQRTVALSKDTTGAPAVDLGKLRAANPGLAKVADNAGVALSKRGLSGVRGQVVLVLDHSGSMYDDFASGAVAKLVTRVLGFAFQIDTDGEVPVIPFDSRVLDTVKVTEANFATVVQDQIWQPRNMGTTNLAGALVKVKELAETSDQPLFVAVVTDGNPDSQSHATQLVCELAGFPVFLKFMALRPVAYLSQLDDLDSSKRLLDNVDAKPEAGSALDLLSCSDAEFVDALVDEWDTWINAALAAGVLKA